MASKWACLYLLLSSIIYTTFSKERDFAPKLRHVVNSLQEQVAALQKEQQHNRLVIQTLETKLDEELFQRNKRRNQDSLRVSTISPFSSQSSSRHKSFRKKSPFHPLLLSPEDAKISTTSIFQSINLTSPLDSHKTSWTPKQDDKRDIDASSLDDSGTPLSFFDWNSFGTTPAARFPNKPYDDNYYEKLDITVSSSMPSATPSGLSAEIKEYFNSQLQSMRTDLYKMRQEVELQKHKFEKEEPYLAELRSDRVTTKWLQKTVVDVRKEVSELATALNISVHIRESQQMETMLDRIRGDVFGLRNELVHKTAGMTKQAALVDELKNELQEVRAMTATMTMDYQQLSEEVSTLKEEFFGEDKGTIGKTAKLWEDGSPLEGSGGEEGSGISESLDLLPQHQNHHFTKEMNSVKEDLQRLQRNHHQLHKDLHALKHNYSTSQSGLDIIQERVHHLDNRTTLIHEEQCLLSKTFDDVQQRLSMAQEKAHENSVNIVNITEAMTGMDKVHSSTIQLFEALEGLESEFSNNIGDLQREISKFEFNVAQVQGSFDILRHDQTTNFEDLKSLKAELVRLNQDFKIDHYRLTNLHNDFLNRSLQRCAQEGQETIQDLKLANLELHLSKLSKREEDAKHQANVMYSKLLQKVDKSALQNVETNYRDVIDDVRNASSQLMNLTVMQFRLKNEMMKFVKQLPQDCSFTNVPNHAKEYNSGLYLIHVPNTQHAKEIYCDMHDDGERWTLIQRRFDGSEDFSKSWDEYKKGFGRPNGEFWFGNEELHLLTQSDNYTLRIEMWDIFNTYLYAEYDDFKVSSEEDLYRLDVGEYRGNASDALQHHKRMAFSTRDRDNDASSTHCAMYYSAGWWYQHCQYVNVNGRYAIGMTWYDQVNKEWMQLTKVEMKIAARRS